MRKLYIVSELSVLHVALLLMNIRVSLDIFNMCLKMKLIFSCDFYKYFPIFNSFWHFSSVFCMPDRYWSRLLYTYEYSIWTVLLCRLFYNYAIIGYNCIQISQNNSLKLFAFFILRGLKVLLDCPIRWGEPFRIVGK